MAREELTVCELWDLTQPIPAPHSRLYHLEPIGIGTMYVESLTSYLTRLAHAHALPLGKLVTHEIAPLLDQQYTPEAVKFVFSRKSHVLNGISPWTARAIFALEKLTGRNELSFLTMWIFNTVLSICCLMRSVQAWCPLCYHEWRQAGQRVYTPLLWALQAITVCPHHNQPLHVRCPNQACQASVPFLAARNEIGYCPRCHCWLGSASPTPDAVTLGQAKLEQAIWQAKATGEILAATPSLTASLSKERVAQVMAAYLESRPTESAESLACSVGLPHNRLNSYLRKTDTLRFDLWLDSCWRLNLSPFHTLVDPEIIKPDGQSDISWVQRIRAEFDAPSQPLDSVEIQQILTAISVTDEKPPPSLNEVARRVKRSAHTLQQHFPELCDVIVERQQAYYQADKRRVQRALEAILNTEQDPLPLLKELAQQLGQSEHFLRRHFPELCCAIRERRRAYHKAEKQRTQRELEAVVEANENPPPTMREVAQQLERSEDFLYSHFPELCHTLTQRQRVYSEAEQQRMRDEFEAILNANENPPPTLGEIAQRLDRTDGWLYRCFPELCRTLTERQRAYYEAEKLRVRRGLEAVLDTNETPPPTLDEVTRRLERSEKFLRHFPELCDAIVARRRAYQESEKSRLQHAWEALLVNHGGSPPSMREVAQQLEQPVLRLRYLFPDLYRATLAQRRVRKTKPSSQDCVADQQKTVKKQSPAELEIKMLQLRQQLETTVAADEMPPPTLRDVARRLGSDSSTLCRHFPDLSQAIVQRSRTYQEAEKLHTQHKLEAILASNEVPPPPLREVACRLGSSSTTLSNRFPDLCQAIVQRRKDYQEAEKRHIQHELQASLTSNQVPPPSLHVVARQLEQTEAMLCHHFPDLCRAIVEQDQAYQQVEKQDIQCKLEAVLADEEKPAPSLREVARRFGYSYDRLRKFFPELCQCISARYLADEKVRSAQKMEQRRAEIRQATFEVWQNGSYPSLARVSSWLSKPIRFWKSELRIAWHEALHELGLSE